MDNWIELEVKKLKECEYNPRKITKEKLEQLKHSLEKDVEFIKARPLLVNERPDGDLIVFGGNQKLKAAKELMWQKIPCVLFKVSLEQERLWNLKDNKLYGENNDELLVDVLKAVYESDLDVSLTGYDEFEVEEILGGEYGKSVVKEFESKTTKLVSCPECGHQFELKKSIKVNKG